MGRRGGRRAALDAGGRRRRLPSLALLRRQLLWLIHNRRARAQRFISTAVYLPCLPRPPWPRPCLFRAGMADTLLQVSSRTLLRTLHCGAFFMARVVVRFQDHDSMSRCSILPWGLLLAICGGCLHTSGPASTSYADPRGFQVVARSGADEAALDSLVRFVESLKNSGHDVYRITRIGFASPTKATVRFLWSGGFHGGQLIVAKKNGAWTLTDEAHYL